MLGADKPHRVAPPDSPEFNLYVHEKGDLYISTQIRDHAIWEPVESSVVLGLLGPGEVFLDLGANIGYYTILASFACGPQGAVYAFEPDPANFDLLERNVALNGLRNTVTVNAAVGATTGSVTLFHSEDNRGDHRTYDTGDRTSSVLVRKVALDDWFAGRSSRVDFVKMDTQGSEVEIIDGMRGLIEANRRHLRMVVEFWPFGLAGSGKSAAALVERLRRFGFSVQKVDESAPHPVPTTWETLLAEAETLYHPDTRHFTNLLLLPSP
jgi:FkbM family methyltransferase